TYLESRGLVRSEGLDQYVALLPPADEGWPGPGLRVGADAALAPSSVVELTDGQRFTGVPTGKAGDQTALEWARTDFGTISIPLELVRRGCAAAEDSRGAAG